MAKGDGPFLKYKDFITNPKIMELEFKRSKEAKVLHKLKHLRVQSVKKPPDWENCYNVSFASKEDYDRGIALSLIAGKLVHENKNPVEIAKSENCIWVKTEAA